MKDVELQLAKEEFEVTASSVQVVHESSRSMFVVLGLEIEDLQYVCSLVAGLRFLIVLTDARSRSTSRQRRQRQFTKRSNSRSAAPVFW